MHIYIYTQAGAHVKWCPEMQAGLCIFLVEHALSIKGFGGILGCRVDHVNSMLLRVVLWFRVQDIVQAHYVGSTVGLRGFPPRQSCLYKSRRYLIVCVRFLWVSGAQHLGFEEVRFSGRIHCKAS